MTSRHTDIVATYERANRIFSGAPITCRIVGSAFNLNDPATWAADGTPAWSIGSEIYFAEQVVDDARGSRAAELALAGLNFHELGHALFTPPFESWLRQQLVERDGLFPALNALEDQRIETLLAARYPTLAGYFVQAFQSFVLDHPDAVHWAHLLAHGRRFLPLPVRQVLFEEFIGAWQLQVEVDAIIDEYRTLILGPDQSPDAERAFRLVVRFGEILAELGQEIQFERHGLRFGGAVTITDQVEAQRARELAEDGSLVLLRGDSRPRSRKPPRVRPRRRVRNATNLDLSPLAVKPTVHSGPIPTEFVEAARRFRVELERLRGDADPCWQAHQATGRLNSRRAMLGADPDTVFDRWRNASSDAADIEAVLLLDCSGSMCDSMPEVCAAAWAIKRAIEAVGGAVTVYSYDVQPGIVYNASERAVAGSMRVIVAHGGTQPLEALRHARGVLSRSRAANRILITLTDGSWFGEVDLSHREVDDLRAVGVLTAIGQLGEEVSDDPHHHEHAMRLDTPAGLVTMARRLVQSSASARLQEAC